MHTIDELKEKQSLPLSLKVRMTQERIRAWVNEYGTEGVYISFSGGKDSTVLLDIVRKMYPDIPAVFVDVPTQYPELKTFAESFDNVVTLKPKISFAQVCEKYGFPLISKEVSECVQGARKYLTSLIDSRTLDRQTDRQTDRPYRYWYDRVTGQGKYKKARIPSADAESLVNPTRGGTTGSTAELEALASLMDSQLKKGVGQVYRTARVLGWWTKNNHVKANIPDKDRSNFNLEKYNFFLDAPFEISHMCCNVMKKAPIHKYAKDNNRLPITAMMADESRLRQQQWLRNGCNGFEMKNPISNPMSFWMENDVLQYIHDNNLPICSVYGEVVEDTDGQISLADLGYMDKETPKYKTTGCSRTGCMLCGFGCHLEKEPNRFQRLKETHPKMYGLLDVIKNNGVTMREAIEWMNDHGKGINIKL